MPLGFPSINQGIIAFGFFNVDTDLLLLEHYFIFADEFCRHIIELTPGGRDLREESWDACLIDRDQIGDLMGAIHDISYTGFIGEVYRRFPFPKQTEEFRQDPEGFRNQKVLEDLLAVWASKTSIPFRADRARGTVGIGEFLFSGDTFQELLRYVWLGGYPRWRDHVRPRYVLEMKEAIEESRDWLFTGLRLDQ